jgi:PhnB protein
MPQLAFRGACRPAFEYYGKVLDGKITVMNSFRDNAAKLPPGSTAAAPDHMRFAELRVGDFAILGNDVPENEYQPMRGFHIALHLKTGPEAKRIFQHVFRGRSNRDTVERGGMVVCVRRLHRPLWHSLAHPRARQIGVFECLSQHIAIAGAPPSRSMAICLKN